MGFSGGDRNAFAKFREFANRPAMFVAERKREQNGQRVRP
jgi:hypothetical protein